VTLAAALPELSSQTGLLDPLDLVGYNYKEHLYEADHERFPHKPFVGSENSHRYTDWLAVAQNAYVAGQFLWTGIDYLGEARGWPIHGSGAGLLTLAGFAKDTWHLRRSWWSDEPVAHIAVRPRVEGDGEQTFRSHPVSRVWDASDGEPIEVVCFGNGDELCLMYGSERLPLVRDEQHGYWSAVTTTRSAPLVLEVRRAGEVVARDVLRPAGEAARIEAAVWKAPESIAEYCESAGITADGVVQVECTLLDERGNVARADRIVTAQVYGGELLGLENGDLGDNTPYSSNARSTLAGRLIVFVRPGAAAAVVLSSPGLPDVRLECNP